MSEEQKMKTFPNMDQEAIHELIYVFGLHVYGDSITELSAFDFKKSLREDLYKQADECIPYSYQDDSDTMPQELIDYIDLLVGLTDNLREMLIEPPKHKL